MTSVCRPLAVQALRKPVCSFGQVPSKDTPLFGGWGDIQICSQHLSALRSGAQSGMQPCPAATGLGHTFKRAHAGQLLGGMVAGCST